MTMNQHVQIQPWKLNSTVTEFMARCAEAGIRNEPLNVRANFYPAGELIFNGGQGAGDGGRQSQLIYDTEKHKKQGEVSGGEKSEAEKHKEPKEVVHLSKGTASINLSEV